MLEGPLIFVAPHGGPKGLLANDAAKLHEEEGALHVGRHLVGEFAVKVVGEGAGGLHPAFVGDPTIAAEVAEVGIREVFTRNHIHGLVFRKTGKALIHPIVALFIGAQHPVKPHVRGLMDDGTEQAVVAAMHLHDCGHGVFHGAFTALNHAELGPVIAAKVVVHKREIGLHICLKLFTSHVLARSAIALVKKVNGQAGGRNSNVVLQFLVGDPGEVVHLIGFEAPCDAVFLFEFHRSRRVSMANFVGILEDPRAANHVARGGRDIYLEGAKVAVKLPRHINVRVPAIGVVHHHFGVPLGETVGDVFGVVPASALHQLGNARGVGHVEGDGLA